MNIRGKVTYIPLETGFWGILDEAGNQWRPVEMPRQLRREGLEVVVKAKPVAEEVSIFQWGKPIEILEIR